MKRRQKRGRLRWTIYSTFISGIELPKNPQEIDAHSLYTAFEQVTDGRKKRGKRYSFPLLLTLLFLARLAGETEIKAAAEWIGHRKDWIREVLPFTSQRVLCLGTYLYALNKIEPQELTKVVAECLTKTEASKRCEEEPSRLCNQNGREGFSQNSDEDLAWSSLVRYAQNNNHLMSALTHENLPLPVFQILLSAVLH